MVNESKLDSSTPDSFYRNAGYFIRRLDRNSNGGGVLVFIRNEYKLLKFECSSEFEIMFFQIKIQNQIINFISTYKPPSTINQNYLDHLEDFLFKHTDKDDPLFIIGDLNMDLVSDKGDELRDFLTTNDLKNYVVEHTRVQTNYFEKKQKHMTSKTLIDVILHNKSNIIQTR